jgi:hypothetical protein
VIGLDDVIVISTSDAVLVTARRKSKKGNGGETGDQHYKCYCIVFEPTPTF